MDMHYDYSTIYRKNAAFFHARPKGKNALLFFNRFAPYLFVLAYAALLGYAVVTLSPKEVAFLLFTPAAALLSVSVLRLVIDRPRPYSEEGANVTPLQVKKRGSSSFPSRHLASAAVLSVCFFPYFPLVGALGILLSVGLGYARFAVGWHYPSDLLAGFFLGLGWGALLFFL